MGKPTKLPKLPMYHELVPGVGGILGGVFGGLGQALTRQQLLQQQQQVALQAQLAKYSGVSEVLQGQPGTYHPVTTEADVVAVRALIYGGQPTIAQLQAEFAARHPHGPTPELEVRERRRGTLLTIDQEAAAYERWLTTCTDGRTFEEWLARAPAVGLVPERRRWWHDVPLERFGQAIGRLAQLMDFEVLGAVTTVGILVYLLLRLL